MKTLFRTIFLSTIFVTAIVFAQQCCITQPARYNDGSYIPGMIIVVNHWPQWVNCEVVYQDQYGPRPVYFSLGPQSYSSPISANYSSLYCG